MRLPFRASRALLLWGALGLVAAITLVVNSSELMAIAGIVAHARAQYLFALLLVQAGFLVNLGLFYRATFRMNGLRADAGRFVLVSSAAHFVNLVSKSSGLGGLALYLREGSRHGESATHTTAAYMAAYAMSYVAFIGVLLVSLGLLYTRGALTSVEAAGAGVLLCIVCTVALVLFRGLRNEAALSRFLTLISRPVNAVAARVLHRPLIAPGQIVVAAGELYASLRVMRSRPRSLAMPFCHALAVELLSALALFFAAAAFGVPLSFPLALAGYALSLLFAILSVTPAGLGFVEASLIIFLVSTGMTGNQAVAVTLGFRLFDFWLPVAVGGISLLALRFGEGSHS